jgi:hypothetical protein
MAYFKLYVNAIIDYENNGIYGLENDIDRIKKNMSIIFKDDDSKLLTEEAKKNSDGISLMYSFCQYIVYIFLDNSFSKCSMAFFDCKNSMNTALDIHLHFTKNGFDKITKEDFMQQFLEIEAVYEQVKDAAELTTQDF